VATGRAVDPGITELEDMDVQDHASGMVVSNSESFCMEVSGVSAESKLALRDGR
jgi:hypothetical protein